MAYPAQPPDQAAPSARFPLWPIVVGAVLTIVVCTRAITAVAVTVRHTGQRAARITSPQRAEPLPTSWTLTTPENLVGQALDTEQQFPDIRAGVNTLLADVMPSANDPAGLYGVIDPVYMRADTGSDKFDQIGALLSARAASNHYRDLIPGVLGGRAGCAETVIAQIDAATCVWSDAATNGILIFFYRSVEDVQVDYLNARGQIESKS